MNIYNTITVTMLLLAGVVINTDSHRVAQAMAAVLIYVLLTVLLISKIIY